MVHSTLEQAKFQNNKYELQTLKVYGTYRICMSKWAANGY